MIRRIKQNNNENENNNNKISYINFTHFTLIEINKGTVKIVRTNKFD